MVTLTRDMTLEEMGAALTKAGITDVSTRLLAGVTAKAQGSASLYRMNTKTSFVEIVQGPLRDTGTRS